jgi:transcriptional regulator with XRE-family HTH domain
MKKERHPALIELGKQIRKKRLERGISQEGFAADAGLGRSYYGGVERGDHNIAALNLMRIAATLEVEVGDLFPKAHVFVGLMGGPNTASEE